MSEQVMESLDQRDNHVDRKTMVETCLRENNRDKTEKTINNRKNPTIVRCVHQTKLDSFPQFVYQVDHDIRDRQTESTSYRSDNT